jgi:hypothetical protein
MAVKNIKNTLFQGFTGSTVLVARLIDQAGNAVSHPSIQNNQSFTRNIVAGQQFILPFALGEGNYSIPGVRFQVMRNNAVLWISSQFTLTVNCGLTQETTNPVSWLQKFAITFDSDTHEASFHLQGDLDTEVNFKAVTGGTDPSGISQDNVPFNKNTWIGGSTIFARPGYAKVIAANPVINGAGGFLPNTQYEARVRRASNPTQVFVTTFTTPSVDTYTPQDIIAPAPVPTTTVAPQPITTTQSPVPQDGTFEAFVHFN